ncbi:MAG: hypothetical protein NVS9B4_22550 [Candidatus Acidiferrum sp.]
MTFKTKLLMMFVIVASLQAGSSAYAQVTLTDNGSSVTLDNGVISADIQKNNGQITSMMFAGFQTVMGNIYYSMDGGVTYQTPGPCIFSVTTQTPDLVDLSFFQPYTTQPHVMDIDIHYVLRTGDSGVYTYAVLSHPGSYAATSVGEWRQVWKLPHDSTDFTFENIYVDTLRNWQMPSFFDVTQASPTSIKEIIKLNTGVRAGLFDGKYEYSANYADLGTYGHASNVNGIGVWAVFGSHEWFNDGPTKNDLTAASGIIHVHFGMNHYGGSSTNVAAGESWSKIYGPYLLYCNSNPDGADALWRDAQARAQAEQAAWPYSWVANDNYPLADGRGTVSGTFLVSDALKPAVSGANAWVGLAQPDPGGNWQYESKRYQYWVKTDADGSFVIPNVRPGSYTLYGFVTGAVGEYAQTDVAVDAGTTTLLGNVAWNVAHPGSSIAWEIGIPDRSAAEFKHGTDYFQGFTWDLFADEFPNPLIYNVGISDWTTHWNYVQSAYVQGGVNNPWPWRINFNLDSVPASGDATLTLAWASADQAAIQVFVNSDTTVFKDFYPSISGGNAFVRQEVHAKYGVDYVKIPVSMLQPGANTITLLERRVSGIASHVMYDYVNLELPPATP